MKMSAAKENIGVGEREREGKACNTMSRSLPSNLVLEACLKLISMNKDSAFELDTFVTLLEKRGTEVSVHDFTNSLRDSLARASDYHWK